MELRHALGLGAPRACDTEDIYNLLVAILPIFVALTNSMRKHLEALKSDPETLKFYIQFEAMMVNLHAVLYMWNPTELVQRRFADEDEVRNNLLKILDELDSRFLSWKSNEVGSACKRLGIERRKDETYPKLRALRRILPEDGDVSEEFVSTLAIIIRLDSKRASKRERLLRNLEQPLGFFYNLQPFDAEPDPSYSLRFSDYPLRHVRKLAEALFNVIQKNWCRCPTGLSHDRRQARLNLTHHQRFDTAPIKGQIVPNNKARFRILFPAPSSRDADWQDTEIAVKNQDYEHDEHIEVEYGLCRVIQGVKAGIRPRMVVFDEKLWQLRVETDRLFYTQVRDSEFKSLRDLLQPDGSRQSALSCIEEKDRLILSFVLATSLMHFVEGPWLQASLNRENICFLKSNSRSTPDITRPYLTTSCSLLTRMGESPRDLNQPHRFPDILSLGILLLEIELGAPIDFEASQDRCVVALGCMDKWVKSRQSSRDSDRLLKAISACIEPTNFSGKDDLDIRKYIFERILCPLGDALSTGYEIRLNALHIDDTRANEANGVGSFDHQDESQLEKRNAANEWLGYLEGVHDLFHQCKDRCRGLPDASQKAARVKIAILDTGLQLPAALQENYEDDKRIGVQGSKTFVPGEATHEWSTDYDGHGSRVGQILLEFAPAADLHIAKVFKTRRDLADPKIASQVHQRISKAIEHAAMEWEVDMIIMCFGFDEPIRQIRDAIEKVTKATKPPLFFAATRNDGAHKRMAWPAKDRSVIGISSTDAYGNPSSFNPLAKDVDALLYAFGEGVPVKVAAPTISGGLITKYVSGTSYATPVAAALAANLLGCVRILVTSTKENQCIYKEVPVELQRMSGMLAVLKRHMRKANDRNIESLLPWDFLSVKLLGEDKFLKEIAQTLREG